MLYMCGRLVEVEYAEIEDRKVRGQLQNVGQIERQVCLPLLAMLSHRHLVRKLVFAAQTHKHARSSDLGAMTTIHDTVGFGGHAVWGMSVGELRPFSHAYINRNNLPWLGYLESMFSYNCNMCTMLTRSITQLQSVTSPVSLCTTVVLTLHVVIVS